MSTSSTMTRVRGGLANVLLRPGGGILVVLVVISAIVATQSSNFLTASNWANIVNQTVFVMILAVGMTIVLIARGIDLSVGSVLGLSGGVAAYLMSNGAPMFVAFAAALAAGTCLGIINGLVITKLGVPDFVATLAMLSVARGILYVWTEAIPFRSYMNNFYYTLGGLNRLFWEITAPMLIAVAVALAGAALLKFTPFGRHVYGVGSNPDAARLSGVNVDRVKISVYALSGFLAALAGILLAGRLTTVHPEMGLGFELTAIAAAVLGGAALTGGKGSVFAAILGALTLTVIQNVINILNINPYWETLIVGVIILVAVMGGRLSDVVLRSRRKVPSA